MKTRRINADKPHLWKADIATSVDQFNQWFMRFAPEAFRATRVETTEHVKAALLATNDLRTLDALMLKAKPGVLPTLRMCTAPPLAVDRLIGLAGASKNLVGRMEKGKLPTRMEAADLDAELTKLCRILSRLLDRDIFPWLDNGKAPTNHERDRASTIVADRLCSAKPMIARQESPIERRRQTIQSALDAKRSAAERNRLGQFATPNALAVEIAHHVKSVSRGCLRAVRFADPSIGTGSFYSAALAVFGPERIESAVGVELDSRFCDAARDLWAATGLDVVQGDFTRIVASSRCPAAPNLVLANPPYVRHHHLEREDKERLQALAYQMAGVKVSGLAGLYVYFLILATTWMEDGGYAAWLVPSEFMDVNYGAALKRYLTDRVTLIRAHRFDPDDVQFGDALVSSVILVFRKMAPPPGHAVEFTFGGAIDEPHASDSIPLDQLRESRKWTVYPSHARNDRRTSSDGSGSTLGDFFRIQRGIATGSNHFFVLDRRDAERRRFPKCCLRPILPSPRFLKTTVIDADKDGYPLIERQLCVIDCDLPESVLKDRHPVLWEYLQTADGLGVKDGYLVSKRTPWYKQEQRDPALFLCTYMGRGSDQKQPFRFIWNRSQAIGTNLYLMLYPKNALARMLRDHADRTADVFALLGQVTGHELRGEGRVYGGGLNKIEPSELARISAAAFVERWPELSSAVQRQEELFRELPSGTGA
jgi:hypothetical protein